MITIGLIWLIGTMAGFVIGYKDLRFTPCLEECIDMFFISLCVWWIVLPAAILKAIMEKIDEK